MEIKLSSSELSQIKKFYTVDGLSISEISKKLPISRYIISNRLKKSGVSVYNKQNELRFNISEVKELLSKGKSLTSIAKILGGTRNAMAKHLLKEGIVVENIQNKSKFNENVFDKIDSQEKAYWLGFVFADGYISSPRTSGKKQYAFEVSLSICDTAHLIKLNDFFCHNKNNVKVDHFRCRFSVSSKHLWTTLNKYGCTPKKSLTLRFPDPKIFSKGIFIKDFIRGYIDGDGCLCISKGKCSLGILGTREFLSSMMTFLPIKKPNTLFKINQKDTTLSLNFNGNSAIDLCKWIYENSNISLERKFLKHKSMLKLRTKNIKTIMK